MTRETMRRPERRTTRTAAALALLALCLSSSALRAQAPDPRYVLWVEPDTNACAAGEVVTFRVFLEVQDGAPAVNSMQFGVCHPANQFRFVDVTLGKDAASACPQIDANFNEASGRTSAGWIGQIFFGALDGTLCGIGPGCPLEIAVARYVCTVTHDRLEGVICLCNELGPAGAPPVSAQLELVDQTVVAPVLECARRECQPPPPRETCDCTGTDFWLAFPGNLSLDPNDVKDMGLMVHSVAGSNVTVEVPAFGILDSFFVPAMGVKYYRLPRELELGLISDVVEKKGIHVTSDEPIQVHGTNDVRFAMDGFLALPTRQLGNEHFALGYSNVHDEPRILNGSQFAIVAPFDETTIDITPTADTDGHPAGATFTITLNRGDTYQLTNLDVFRDLSGTEILSSRPIAVFGSHRCATLPAADEWFCNHNVEQLHPGKDWGTNFFTLPYKGRSADYRVRVVARVTPTNVLINGVAAAVMNRGEVKEFVLGGRAHIATDAPALVAQYSPGSWVDDVDESDPSMTLVQPRRHFGTSAMISTPENWFPDDNWLHVVVPAAGVGAVLLDGVPIPAADFNAIGASGFSGAAVPISKGSVHTLVGQVEFGVMSYGYDLYDAYSYPVCFDVGRIIDADGNVIDCDRGGGGRREICDNQEDDDGDGDVDCRDPDCFGVPPCVPGAPADEGPRFIRGDSNASGGVDISDGVATLLHLFAGLELSCEEAADANGSGAIDLSDPVATFNHLFQGGPAPPGPYPECGPDSGGKVAIRISCKSFEPCGR